MCGKNMDAKRDRREGEFFSGRAEMCSRSNLRACSAAGAEADRWTETEAPALRRSMQVVRGAGIVRAW